MLFFTADTHFNHENIIRYCKRPFGSVREMNEALIENWNRVVRSEDDVYHLGDVGWGAPARLGRILDRLNGRITLVTGSHDRPALACRDRFVNAARLMDVHEQDESITLCHYCMRVWPRSHYNTWHLFGHSHGGLEPRGKSWDVGVDVNDFTPLSFDQVREIMAARPDNFNLVKPRRPVG